MKNIFLIFTMSLFLTGCLSNRAFNALGETADRLSEHYYQQDLMQLQHNYQMQQIDRMNGGSTRSSGNYCFQLSDGNHCY